MNSNTNEPASRATLQMLTIKQAAQALAVCDETIRRRIRSGQVPAIRIGAVLRVRLEDLLAALAVGKAA